MLYPPTTCQTQVAGFRHPTLRPRHDVVYRHRDTSLLSRTQTILTAILGSLSHKSPQSRRQPCHLCHPPTFLPLLYRRQTVSALLQACVGFSLQGGEALPGLYQRLQPARFVRCEGVASLVLRD